MDQSTREQEAPERDAVTPLIEVFVQGRPVTQGSKKIMPRGGKKGAPPVLIADNDGDLKRWRKFVHDAVWMACRESKFVFPVFGPVALTITFLFVRHGEKSDFPGLDLDKLERAVFDSLKTAGAVKDDKQVVWVAAQKRWSDRNGCGLMMEPWNP